MSRALVSRILAIALLTGALLCGRTALANVASLQDLLANGLVPSAAPSLLGPITSVGRKGWDCKPERAAAAQRSHDAELPSGPAGP